MLKWMDGANERTVAKRLDSEISSKTPNSTTIDDASPISAETSPPSIPKSTTRAERRHACHSTGYEAPKVQESAPRRVREQQLCLVD